MKHSQSRRDECTHAISAKLTSEAFEIYKEWRFRRAGGREISNAILSHARNKSELKTAKEEIHEIEHKLRAENIQQRNEMLEMRKNIKALQGWITKFASERDEVSDELRELWTPNRPPNMKLDEFLD